MTEKYILVSDEEYCYTLDTLDENYKTLEDFEKQEFENAKNDNVDIEEYEDEILQLASDKYWDWVYTNHLEADTVNDIINELFDENEQLKQRINSRLHFYRELYDSTKDIIAKRVVEDLEDILKR